MLQVKRTGFNFLTTKQVRDDSNLCVPVSVFYIKAILTHIWKSSKNTTHIWKSVKMDNIFVIEFVTWACEIRRPLVLQKTQ